MYAAINHLAPHHELTLFTGDLLKAADWLSKAEAIDDMSNVHLGQETLGLVYPAIGNHNTYPVNIFPLDDIPLTRDWQYV